MLFDVFVTCHAAGSAVLSATILTGCLRAKCSRVPRCAALAGDLAIIVPAYNAATTLEYIANTLKLARDIKAEAIIVDDGSNDGSGPALAALCETHGARLLHHRANRGKPAALNTGVHAATAALAATIDADTVVERQALVAASLLFVDPSLAAVAPTLRVASGGILSALQAAEYRYILGFDRFGLAGIGQVHTVPGAASVWRRSALIGIGGFSDRTLAEDTDATIALRAAGWTVSVIPSVSATTLVPRSPRALIRQRMRWIWGTLQSTAWHGWEVAATPVLHRGPAICFGAISAFHISGFVLPVWSLLLIARSAFGDTALLGLLVIIAIGMTRLIVATLLLDGSIAALPRVILCAGAMHLINTVAFWSGLLVGAPLRRRWR